MFGHCFYGEKGVWSLFRMGRRVFDLCFVCGGGCLVLVLYEEEGI